VLTVEHMRLLQKFGRNPVQKRATPRERTELWRLACEAAKLDFIPQDEVVEEWKKFVVGESSRSQIAMRATIDPAFITIGICYDKRLSAAHTTKTRAHLRQVLAIYATVFPKEDDFRAAVQTLVNEVSAPPSDRKK
jgi:hypothetical protein